MTEDEKFKEALLIELREIKRWLELTYNLFAKYDAMALLGIEELREAEEKPR